MRFLPLIFLMFVAGEIATFIVVGQSLGVLLTLLLLFASFVAGATLIRSTGLAFSQMMGRSAASPDEASRLATSASFRMLAGLLLMVPGFLTDVLALVLLIPSVQQRFRGKFSGSFGHFKSEWRSGADRQGPIIDGEAIEIQGEIADESDHKRSP